MRASTLFTEIAFFAYSNARLNQALAEIHEESPDFILNSNETEYLTYLESRFQLEPIVFDFEKITMDTHEQLVPADFRQHLWSLRGDHTRNNRTYFTFRLREILISFGVALLNHM
jgi:hypothetical protein